MGMIMPLRLLDITQEAISILFTLWSRRYSTQVEDYHNFRPDNISTDRRMYDATTLKEHMTVFVRAGLVTAK